MAQPGPAGMHMAWARVAGEAGTTLDVAGDVRAMCGVFGSAWVACGNNRGETA